MEWGAWEKDKKKARVERDKSKNRLRSRRFYTAHPGYQEKYYTPKKPRATKP